MNNEVELIFFLTLCAADCKKIWSALSNFFLSFTTYFAKLDVFISTFILTGCKIKINTEYRTFDLLACLLKLLI